MGALSNYTFEWIPIQRLNAHDLEQQPGAKLALAIIILILSLVVIKQVFYFRREGRLIRYLGIYGTFIGAILLSLLLPGLSLRIHHYILALLLLPGTSMQTRPALLYQGLLVGLFTGVAAFAAVTLNFVYMMTGSAGVNPFYALLGVMLVLAWRNAGIIGLDSFALKSTASLSPVGSFLRRITHRRPPLVGATTD